MVNPQLAMMAAELVKAGARDALVKITTAKTPRKPKNAKRQLKRAIGARQLKRIARTVKAQQ